MIPVIVTTNSTQPNLRKVGFHMNENDFSPPPTTIHSNSAISQLLHTQFRPFKTYIILLGGGGEVTKRLHKITSREGGIHKKITLDYDGGGGVKLAKP